MSDPLGYAERTYRSHDGLALYYRDYGSPEAPALPLLCLAGLTRNSKDFDDLARRHAGRRRVLAPDYRGRGRSQHDPHWRNYTAQVSLQDTLALLDVAGVERAIVVGTSMGGLLAMALAAARPRALAGVILNDVGPDIELSGLRQILDWIRHDRPQPDYETAARYLKARAPQIGVRSDEGWLKLARNTWRRGDNGLLHFDYDLNLAKPLAEYLRHGGPAPDLWALYGALRPLPALLLRGENSNLLSRACAARMKAVKPDLDILEVAGAGHVPQLDEPEVVEAIDAFLARL